MQRRSRKSSQHLRRVSTRTTTEPSRLDAVRFDGVIYVVYKHTNCVNDKAYIGWSSLTMEERWAWHCYDAIRARDRFVFHAAIRKYGVDAWNHAALEMYDTADAAKLAEIRLIAEHQTFCYE